MIDKLNMGYAPAFYVYDGLHVIAAVLALFMSLNVKLPAGKYLEKCGNLAEEPESCGVYFLSSSLSARLGDC